MKNSFIKNEHLLSFSEGDLDTLRARAELHRRYSNIQFKVLECTDDSLVVRITQGKSHAGNYFDQKRLVEITHEAFDDLSGGRKVKARPFVYHEPVVDVVTDAWIRDRMTEHGLKVKDMSLDLDVDANTISAYKNGVKPLSGVVRAMFYYYFRCKQLEKAAAK